MQIAVQLPLLRLILLILLGLHALFQQHHSAVGVQSQELSAADQQEKSEGGGIGIGIDGGQPVAALAAALRSRVPPELMNPVRRSQLRQRLLKLKLQREAEMLRWNLLLLLPFFLQWKSEKWEQPFLKITTCNLQVTATHTIQKSELFSNILPSIPWQKSEGADQQQQWWRRHQQQKQNFWPLTSAFAGLGGRPTAFPPPELLLLARQLPSAGGRRPATVSEASRSDQPAAAANATILAGCCCCCRQIAPATIRGWAKDDGEEEEEKVMIMMKMMMKECGGSEGEESV
jgi:hypothetical protein